MRQRALSGSWPPLFARTQEQLSVCKGCPETLKAKVVSGYSPESIVCGPHL